MSNVETTYSYTNHQNLTFNKKMPKREIKEIDTVQEDSAENYQSTPQIEKKEPEVSGYLALIKKKKRFIKRKLEKRMTILRLKM